METHHCRRREEEKRRRGWERFVCEMVGEMDGIYRKGGLKNHQW